MTIENSTEYTRKDQVEMQNLISKVNHLLFKAAFSCHNLDIEIKTADYISAKEVKFIELTDRIGLVE